MASTSDTRTKFELDTEDLIEDKIVTEDPIQETERQLALDTDNVSIDAVSSKLLRENLLLTALELHTELVESGRELPRLRDFFSNPANFERIKQSEATSPGLPRTSSCQTFDSLDFARYSDDGDRQVDDRVAVLEFELRKAHDTIKSLRATLTRSAETELPSPVDHDSPLHMLENVENDDPIRPYEKRALNHLVNEYLLQNDNKLTAVTFAEENENQDFEDWDDVGLNVPKPPDLVHLYRDFSQHAMPVVSSEDFHCQVALPDEAIQHREEELLQIIQELKVKVEDLEVQIQSLQSENLVLAEQLMFVERKQEESGFAKTSTPAVTPVKKIHPDKEIRTKTWEVPAQDGSHQDSKMSESLDVKRIGEETEEEKVPAEIDSVSHEGMPAVTLPCEGSVEEKSRITQADDNETGISSTDENSFTSYLSRRKMSETFRRALLSTSFSLSQDNRILSEVNKIIDSSHEKVVLMLGRCLPHIVPNVLLNKREELIPLILCTATLHPETKERDQLLNILFNLIKKPDHEQRQMILTGCVAFAQHVGAMRVEAELLPQCWEQINHKYAERRLLVAEACGALAPYLPNDIRSSLVLSMLQQMLCDDKDDEVRESVVRSLGLLIGFIDDKDKYTQGYELLLLALYDSSEKVAAITQQVYVPSFGSWAEELEKLRPHLIPAFLDKIENLTKNGVSAHQKRTIPMDEARFGLLVTTLQEMMPILFASTLVSGPYIDKFHTLTVYNNIEASTRFPKTSSELTELSVILGSHERLSRLLHLYEEHLQQEGAPMWQELSWVADELIPRLLVILGNIDVSSPKITHMLSQFFFHICRYFGRRFTNTKIAPKFQTVLYVPEEQLDTQKLTGQILLCTCTVPVYVAGVVTAFNKDEDKKHLVNFLKDLVCVVSLSQSPLDSIKAAFSELSVNSSLHESLLAVLWEAVVHTSALVRISAARLFELVIRFLSEMLVANRAVPALVTLASDSEISVRIATVAAFGTVVENVTERMVLDKVYMQFQTFLDDPIYKDQHSLHLELIKTFARVGPNAEPKFRDEIVLPRLALMAASNNQTSNETRRKDTAAQLHEAFTALACCFINDRLIQEAMLPGLRCLKADFLVTDITRVDVVSSMIHEFEDKLEAARADRSSLSSVPAGSSSPSLSHSSFTMGLTDDNMKAKMLHRLKDLKDKSTTARVSNIFGRKK